MTTIRTEIDLSGVYSMVETFEYGLDDAERFAINQINEVIRRDVLGISVRNLCSRAGPGWPEVYTEHLVYFMQLNTRVEAYSVGVGTIEVEVDFSNLGDYSDLERGFHMGALIDSGEKWNIHPPQVVLPYNGQTLLNEVEKRADFWERAIVNREPYYVNRGKKGVRLITNVPSLDEVYNARVSAWISLGVAPQWVLLENGYTEYEPHIYSVDFVDALESIVSCVARTIYEGALVTLIKLAESAGESVRVVGRSAPRSGRSGRFISYKNVLDQSVPDYSRCLGRF